MLLVLWTVLFGAGCGYCLVHFVAAISRRDLVVSVVFSFGLLGFAICLLLVVSCSVLTWISWFLFDI